MKPILPKFISVVIPLYNKEKYIVRTIQSVLDQSQVPMEIIVIDDGSTDKSLGLVRNHFPKEVKIYSKINEGVSATRNLGIQLAKAPYVAFMDADDYWHPLFLEKITEGIKLFPNQEIIATSYASGNNNLESNNSTWLFMENPFNIFLGKSIIKTSSIIIKRDFFEKSAKFNINLTRGEDIEVWYRAICSSGGLVFCQDKLVYYESEVDESLTRINFPINRFYISIVTIPSYLNTIIFKNDDIKTHFTRFLIPFLRFNLFRHFKIEKNKSEIRRILSEATPKLLLIDFIFYIFPYKLLSWALDKPKIRKLLMKYTNFCLKKIYRLK